MLVDGFRRSVSYLRLSVTDRCDLRCTYCMPERMRFMPRADLLSIAELDRAASAFVRMGVRKLRLTGGEPLVRKGVVELVESLSRHLRGGAVDEITLTTNASRLAAFAEPLARAGIRRINVSLDHLDQQSFERITRGGRLDRTLAGIAAAREAGIAVKINTVVLRNDNLDHLVDLVAWAHDRQMAITFIEVMPMGDVGIDRLSQHVPMPEARALIERRWPIADIALRTGGPARYATTAAGGLIGFITPLSARFCEGCNRVRLGANGLLHACLGRDVAVDLRPAIRGSADDRDLSAEIRRLVAIKPRQHDFQIAAGTGPAVSRVMAATGG